MTGSPYVSRYDRAIRSDPAFDALYGERGLERVGLAERTVVDRSVDLVGGDVHEAVDTHALRDVAHDVGAETVGAHELVRVHDRPVDMALGREMHDDVVAFHGSGHRITVADVALHERVAGVGLEVVQGRLVAGVGQRVVDRDLVVAGREHATYVVGPDEAGGAGDEQPHRGTILADPGHPRRNPGERPDSGTLFLPMDEDAGLDWFGKPLPPSQGGARLAVPCPFCSELFQEGPALARSPRRRS